MTWILATIAGYLCGVAFFFLLFTSVSDDVRSDLIYAVLWPISVPILVGSAAALWILRVYLWIARKLDRER